MKTWPQLIVFGTTGAPTVAPFANELRRQTADPSSIISWGDDTTFAGCKKDERALRDTVDRQRTVEA